MSFKEYKEFAKAYRWRRMIEDNLFIRDLTDICLKHMKNILLDDFKDFSVMQIMYMCDIHGDSLANKYNYLLSTDRSILDDIVDKANIEDSEKEESIQYNVPDRDYSHIRQQIKPLKNEIKNNIKNPIFITRQFVLYDTETGLPMDERYIP